MLIDPKTLPRGDLAPQRAASAAKDYDKVAQLALEFARCELAWHTASRAWLLDELARSGEQPIYGSSARVILAMDAQMMAVYRAEIAMLEKWLSDPERPVDADSVFGMLMPHLLAIESISKRAVAGVDCFTGGPLNG